VVRWSVDQHRFAIRQIPQSRDSYELEVLSRVPARYGRPSQSSRLRYTYKEGVGVETFRVEGAPDIWRRCEGRLMFDDLRTLARAIPDDRIDSR
jgi:hypothetical protein